ncbi:hypothetical protein QR685DRAFT_511636 [Neurospora intermedia]|uniref:Secreted protein n=1 Tax=Neurospora intermedia TaxID=5142 RepID=A0ABR3DQY4_NEUIN
MIRGRSTALQSSCVWRLFWGCLGFRCDAHWKMVEVCWVGVDSRFRRGNRTRPQHFMCPGFTVATSKQRFQSAAPCLGRSLTIFVAGRRLERHFW